MNNNKNRQRIEIKYTSAVQKNLMQVSGKGAFSLPEFAEARLIPVLMIDMSTRPDLQNYINLHCEEKGFVGDVKTAWEVTHKLSKKSILSLELDGPVKTIARIEFTRPKDTLFIEKILVSEGFYLQHGKKGELPSATLDRNKVYLEIPHMSFRNYWDKTALKDLSKKHRKSGLKRKDAMDAAKMDIMKVRTIYSMDKSKLKELKDYAIFGVDLID